MTGQVFQFDEATVRTIHDEHGRPLWVALDVCRAIGLGKPENAYARLDEEERVMRPTQDASGRTQEMLLVTERGLYTLILGSRQERARRFKRWITQEVLPQVRQAGRYEPELEGVRPGELAIIEADPGVQQTRRLLAVVLDQTRQKLRLDQLDKEQRRPEDEQRQLALEIIAAHRTAPQALATAADSNMQGD